MKGRFQKNTATAAKEATVLLSSFCKVRLLHYAGVGPIRGPGILDKLRSHGCPMGQRTVNRMLLRMARNG